MNKSDTEAGLHRKRVLAVIGPGSNTSRGIWREIKEQGWLSVAVMPQDATKRGLMNPPDDGWDAVMTVSRWNASTLIRLLAGVDGVIGDEGSIALADKVAQGLGLPHNNPRTSAARYDKAAMTEALRLKGLPVPQTFLATSIAEARVAAKTIGYPLVVKLPASCAGDGFAICKTADELEDAWRQRVGQRSILGDAIDSMLVQELLTGPIYTINCITVAPGEHLMIDAWRDIHHEGGATYGRSDLIEPDDPLHQTLAKRVAEVLDATGLKWGSSHTEIMQNAAGELVVIDLAARLGGWYPRAIRLAGDVTPWPSPAEVAVLEITDLDGLRRRMANSIPPRGKVTILFMVVPRDGMIVDAVVLDEVSRLPVVRGMIGPQPGAAYDHLAGQAVPKTTSMVNLVGAWVVAGPPDTVEATVKKIRKVEQRQGGLYRRAKSVS